MVDENNYNIFCYFLSNLEKKQTESLVNKNGCLILSIYNDIKRIKTKNFFQDNDSFLRL